MHFSLVILTFFLLPQLFPLSPLTSTAGVLTLFPAAFHLHFRAVDLRSCPTVYQSFPLGHQRERERKGAREGGREKVFPTLGWNEIVSFYFFPPSFSSSPYLYGVICSQFSNLSRTAGKIIFMHHFWQLSQRLVIAVCFYRDTQKPGIWLRDPQNSLYFSHIFHHPAYSTYCSFQAEHPQELKPSSYLDFKRKCIANFQKQISNVPLPQGISYVCL